MSCPLFEEPIARYIGGDLPDSEAPAIERHIHRCPACAAWADALIADRQWLSQRPPEAADVDYAGMRRHIREAIERPRRIWWRWLPVAAAAAAAILIFAPHRPAPRKTLTVVAKVAAPVPAPAPITAPPVAPRKQVTPKPQPPLTLEAAIAMFQALNSDPAPLAEASGSPVEMRITTGDPNVTIILVQSTNGDSR